MGHITTDSRENIDIYSTLAFKNSEIYHSKKSKTQKANITNITKNTKINFRLKVFLNSGLIFLF